ncbi:RHS repeat-associated core domain-containing protein [Dongia sedimenti]|uniref:RHS repeat-associated core domain-containing protein n=1 Tax=Dongia sedimenti TaxID=3064282 RepID=A0ABU0YKN0_9PROT|nr:RHS repeat-associated core domain-containing protein [Rhodospirillaceae bacterium R-7]
MISYDLNGNLTNDGTRAFTWDARNRLTGITGVASYVYDGVDRRQSVTQGATTVTALYDGYDPVQEQSPTGTVSANLQIGLGVDERFTRTKAGATSTYLTDLLGSTVALADSAGVVQTSYGYDPYGVSSQTGAANDNPYQFTGRQNDGTGLYYYRARYYNPSWGRFISEDPIGLSGGINQYAYVGGNPISLTDPIGLYVDAMGGYYPDEPCPGFDYNPLEHPYITGGMAAGVLAAPFALAGGEMVLAAPAVATVSEFSYTGTVAGHQATRAYQTSQLLVREIMAAGRGVADPGGAPGALKYLVEGGLNGSPGTWDLVVSPATGLIYHFLFTSH